jgi:hypothetical protein
MHNFLPRWARMAPLKRLLSRSKNRIATIYRLRPKSCRLWQITVLRKYSAHNAPSTIQICAGRYKNKSPKRSQLPLEPGHWSVPGKHLRTDDWIFICFICPATTDTISIRSHLTYRPTVNSNEWPRTLILSS